MIKRKLSLFVLMLMVLGMVGCKGDEYPGVVEPETNVETELESEIRMGVTEAKTETEAETEGIFDSQKPEDVVKSGADFLEGVDLGWVKSGEETDEYMDVELDGEDSYPIEGIFDDIYAKATVCILQDLQQTEDGTYQLVVLPVTFVFSNETERMKALGYDPDNFDGYYELILNYSETVTYALSEEALFYVSNVWENRELAKRSKNHRSIGYCELDDPVLFFQFMIEMYGTKVDRSSQLMLLNYDEDGKVNVVYAMDLF